MHRPGKSTLRNRLSAGIVRFARDPCGNFAIIASLAALPVAGIAGLALDYSHVRMAEQRLQSAVDAAAIAGVAAAGEPVARLQALVADFVDANTQGMGASVETTVNGSRMTVVASVDVATPLLGIVSRPVTRVNASVIVESPVRLDAGSVGLAGEDKALNKARREMKRVLSSLPPHLRDRLRARHAGLLAGRPARFTR